MFASSCATPLSSTTDEQREKIAALKAFLEEIRIPSALSPDGDRSPVREAMGERATSTACERDPAPEASGRCFTE